MTPSRHRVLLVLTVCCGLAGLTSSSAAAQGASLWLEPQTLTLAPDEEATLEIWVGGVTQLAGAEVHLTFDQALLEVIDAESEAEGVQITHGGFLSPDFVVQNAVDLTEGTVDYAIACNPVDKAASGSGVLARVNFRALSEGETSVDIRSALLADKAAQAIAVETSSSVIVVSRPGPSSAVWALIGLVAVAVAAGSVTAVWRTFKARW